MATISLTGYTDQISVRPGETVDIKISAENAPSAEVEIVRIIHGDEHPEGPGFIEEVIPSDISGTHQVRRQFVDAGNAVVFADPQGVLALQDSFTICALIYPTTPDKGRQVVMGRFSLDETAGYALGIDPQGRLAFWVADGSDTDEIVSEIPLVHHTWYLACASYDARSGEAILHHQAIVNPYNGRLGRVA
ncbi:MAG: LamG-like jellyroll fold domain-containing protein, partial [Actinomycetales bacterium]